MNFRDQSLSIAQRVEALIAELTLDEKIGLLSGRQAAVERLGIKECEIGTEVARGWSSHDETQFCTVFPQTIGLAAAFDRELIREAGKVCGREMRAYNNSVNKSLFCFGPTVDLERDPRWGRHEEGYGEDPFLTKTMSTAYMEGIVGNEKYLQAVPLLKHFACNNAEENRGSYDAVVPERLKMEYYYEVFREPIVKGVAFGVMAAYNKLNGMPGLLNPDNMGIIKEQWGGRMICSDGGGFSQVMTAHKLTNSHGETMKLALNAGANTMLDGADMITAAANEAVENGWIDEAVVNKAVYDTLYLRFCLGEFDSPENNPYLQIGMDQVNTEADKKLSCEYVKKQTILLKNDGLLPLNPHTVKSIAVVGPQADENFLDWYTGASSYDITMVDGLKEAFPDTEILCDHGRDLVKLKNVSTGKYLRVLEDGDAVIDAEEADAEVFEKYDWGWGYVNYKSTTNGKMLSEDQGQMKATAKDAYMWFVRPIMRPHEAEGGVTFTLWNNQAVIVDETGRLFMKEEEPTAKDVFSIEVISDGTERCRALAEKAEVAICCVGNHPVQVGREGYDRSDIRLAPRQEELARAASAANKNTILLMISSYPFAIEEFDKTLPAIVFSTHAGPEVGRGVSAVLNGSYNPAGRSVQTWYKADYPFMDIHEYDIEKSHMTYLYMQEKPLYPFGYGLSYSSFRYHDIEIVPAEEGKNAVIVTVMIDNTSEVDGEEVPQLYFGKPDSVVSRPERKLCGYDRVMIPAGETRQVTFIVDRHSLSYYDPQVRSYVLEAGKYEFSVGPNAGEMALTREYVIE